MISCFYASTHFRVPANTHLEDHLARFPHFYFELQADGRTWKGKTVEGIESCVVQILFEDPVVEVITLQGSKQLFWTFYRAFQASLLGTNAPPTHVVVSKRPPPPRVSVGPPKDNTEYIEDMVSDKCIETHLLALKMLWPVVSFGSNVNVDVIWRILNKIGCQVISTEVMELMIRIYIRLCDRFPTVYYPLLFELDFLLRYMNDCLQNIDSMDVENRHCIEDSLYLLRNMNHFYPERRLL